MGTLKTKVTLEGAIMKHGGPESYSVLVRTTAAVASGNNFISSESVSNRERGR